MQTLRSDWFVEGLVDFEYKKYILLAYMQHISKQFAEWKLYPHFADLIHHYENLAKFQQGKEKLRSQFPKELDQEQFQQLNLQYVPQIQDGIHLQEIDEIVAYAMPVMRDGMRLGKEIYEEIEEKLVIEPVGIMPIYRREGYVLLRIDRHQPVQAYQYKIVLLENMGVNYHAISFRKVQEFTYSISNTFEAMKRSLIRAYQEMPNPATYLLYSPKLFPQRETLLPIAKRQFLQYVRSQA